VIDETRSGGERGKERKGNGEREKRALSDTGQTLQEIAAFALQRLPAEILTFPKIRNLPEGHGLIPSTDKSRVVLRSA
jgi:hypothetical protein